MGYNTEAAHRLMTTLDELTPKGLSYTTMTTLRSFSKKLHHENKYLSVLHLTSKKFIKID
jgi:hypothetical protein